MKFSIKLFLSLFLIVGTVAYAADTASILPPAKTTFLDSNGKPLTGGSVDFYIPSTTTRKATWQDSAETILNTNPVVLDAAGRALILGSGSYRQVVKDKNNNLIWDQVTASPGGSGGGGAIGDSNPIGTVLPFNGFVVPSSYVLAYGQEISRVTYATYFSAVTQTQNITCTGGSNVLTSIADTTKLNIGAAVEASCIPTGSLISAKTVSSVTLNNNATISITSSATFLPFGGGNGLTTFNVPDYRGRLLPGRCNMGGASCSLLTSTYYGSDPNAIYASGGTQSKTLLTVNLPAYTPTGTLSGTFPGSAAIPVANLVSVGGATDVNRISLKNNANTDAGVYNVATTSTTLTNAPIAGVAQGGVSTPISVISPSVTIDYIVKIIANSIVNSYTGSGVIVLQDSPTINNPIINNATFVSDSGPLILNGETVPTLLATSQNNYNPSSVICTTTSELQLSASTSINITGFGGGVAGCILKIINYGSNTITFKVENSSSTATNRLGIATDLALLSQQSTVFTYDGVNSRWRLIGGPPANSSASIGVTAVATGNCLTGGTITTSGTIAFTNSCLPFNISQYTAGGTANDTTGVQAAFTACAVTGCQMACAPGVIYTVDAITVGSSTYFNGAGCTFQQRVQGFSIFTGSGVSKVRLTNVILIGKQVGSNLAAPISGDSAISFTGNSSDLWFDNFYITRFGLYAIFVQQSSNVNITNGHVFENAFGTWFRGVEGFAISDNLIKHTAMYTLTPTANQLASAIALESTDQNPYGISTKGTISNNVIQDFPLAQGIFGHAARWVSIVGNTCYNVSTCISLNPYNTTDQISNMTVNSNIGEGTSVSNVPAGFTNAGLVLNGGGCGAGSCPLIGTVVGGSGYVDGIYPNVPFTGSAHRCDTTGTPYIASATITVLGGAVKSFTNLGVLPNGCTGTISYISGDVLSASNANLGGSGSGFTYTLTSVIGGTTPVIQSTTVANNSMHGYNRANVLPGVIPDAGSGCFFIGFTNATSVTGNIADACGANGFVFSSEETGSVISGNTAKNPSLVTTTQNGFLFNAAPRLTLMSNMVSGANDTNGIGYKIVGSDANLKYKDSGGVLLNGTFDTTTPSSP